MHSISFSAESYSLFPNQKRKELWGGISLRSLLGCHSPWKQQQSQYREVGVADLGPALQDIITEDAEMTEVHFEGKQSGFKLIGIVCILLLEETDVLIQMG